MRDAYSPLLSLLFKCVDEGALLYCSSVRDTNSSLSNSSLVCTPLVAALFICHLSAVRDTNSSLLGIRGTALVAASLFSPYPCFHTLLRIFFGNQLFRQSLVTFYSEEGCHRHCFDCCRCWTTMRPIRLRLMINKTMMSHPHVRLTLQWAW